MLISVIVPILNRKFDLGLSVEELLAIIVGPNVWAIGQSLRSSRATAVTTAIAVFFFVAVIPQTADARGPLRRVLGSTTNAVANVAVGTAATVQVAAHNAVDIVSDKYQRALASAQYRAAHLLHGHATHLELGNGVTQSGVGWASHDSNPMTCLGRRGFTRATCAVVAGPDGWYATCVQ